MVSNPLKRNLRAKVTLGIALPLLLVLGIFTAIEYSRHQATVLNNLSILASLSGDVIESSLRHAMLDSDFTEVRGILDTLGRNGEFKGIYVLDPTGRVIFASNTKDVETQLRNDQSGCQPCHSMRVESRPRSVVVVGDDGQRLFRTMNPIENGPQCAECHDANERLLGLLLTDIPLAPLEEALKGDLRENVAWWLGTILITVIVVNLVLSRFLLRRLEGLAAAITGLGREQLSQPLPEWPPDEIGKVATAFNAMANQVEERSAENRALSEDLRHQHALRGELLKRLISTQENERRWVAREIHDELGQALGALSLRAEVMERLLTSDSENVKEQLDQIRTLIQETTDHMYGLILDLRPSALDDLGLAAALRIYAERLLSGTGIAYTLDVEAMNSRLPPTVETAVYRIFQETLSNVVRHSGAKHVQIRLARHDGLFEGGIVDDGRGFNLEAVRPNGQNARGLGLLGIQERIAQCGGQVEIRSQPGSGTGVHVRIPLTEEECCE